MGNRIYREIVFKVKEYEYSDKDKPVRWHIGVVGITNEISLYNMDVQNKLFLSYDEAVEYANQLRDELGRATIE